MGALWKVGFTRRELATVLAALRMYQRLAPGSTPPELDIATDGGLIRPMTVEAIDDLCVRLNMTHSPLPDPKANEEPQRFTSAQDMDLIHKSDVHRRVLEQAGFREVKRG